MILPLLRQSSFVVPLIFAFAGVGLSGCDKLTPNGQSNTMSLLRSGSEKVCVAPDVQQTLRELIFPKVEDVEDDGSVEDKRAAIKALSLSYDLTTLQSFDQSVTKASCNTTVRISNADGKSSKFPVAYFVSPSAENGNSFVIGAETGEVRAYAGGLIKNAVADASMQRATEQEEIDQAQARASLLATVTPKWLVGTWIDPDSPATACTDGNALVFQANHSVEGHMVAARWVLNGNKLHIVGSNPTGPIDKSMTITDADALSFKYDSDTAGSLRRCTRDDVTNPLNDTMTD